MPIRYDIGEFADLGQVTPDLEDTAAVVVVVYIIFNPVTLSYVISVE